MKNLVIVESPAKAKTIEGSVGGTVNLRTIRPLELTETLGNIRVQGEDSSLTTDGMQPRISGAFGKNWETSSGKFGFVLSGSYTEQEATSSFRYSPRVIHACQFTQAFFSFRFGEIRAVLVTKHKVLRTLYIYSLLCHNGHDQVVRLLILPLPN